MGCAWVDGLPACAMAEALCCILALVRAAKAGCVVKHSCCPSRPQHMHPCRPVRLTSMYPCHLGRLISRHPCWPGRPKWSLTMLNQGHIRVSTDICLCRLPRGRRGSCTPAPCAQNITGTRTLRPPAHAEGTVPAPGHYRHYMHRYLESTLQALHA